MYPLGKNMAAGKHFWLFLMIQIQSQTRDFGKHWLSKDVRLVLIVATTNP
jgi:hypothetical protein